MIAKVKATCDKCNGSGVILEVNPAKLREIRVKAGLSLRDLAERGDLTAPYLSDVERGRRNFTPRLEKLYAKLDKS